jgi:cold shock CspA family protein
MAQGEVLYYSEKMGYCFIRPNDGGEGIFVPRTAIARTDESEPLEPGDRVIYGTARTKGYVSPRRLQGLVRAG